MAVPVRPTKLQATDLLAKVRSAVANGRYRILPHARLRCTERDVAAADLELALTTGRHVLRRDRYETVHQAWSYCFEGATIDGDDLRVVVAFEDWMLIVTVVRLGIQEEH